MDKTEYEVLAAVQAMNKCWTGKDPDLEKLHEYFHDMMVAITPMDRFRVEGKEACVAGWSNFAKSVAIRHWTEKEIHIQVYKEEAAVMQSFDVFRRTITFSIIN
ncbi:MAG: hypothetical protein VR65_06550 [Desulfobulbaceae bacterium BRH_c16a]|nr:MAG: hypothetical protein VR65_25340 [Desulfobulbaceae bacterium BRH_c16a]KJS02285.1 MAG: hypothetical protein VR65_06550 [Desulfobulbaceae bacterium BRH_c16a]